MTNTAGYSGPTTVQGTLLIKGSQPNSDVTVSGGILGGRGTVGALSVGPGTVWPSASDAGTDIIHSGPATFSAGSSFRVNLKGANSYDQLIVDGAVDLSGRPTLNASLDFASLPNQSFTILTSTGGITGTFAGLPDGTNFGLSGTPMQIHYTGNSVVLTHRPQFILPPAVYTLAGTGPTLVAVGDFRGNGLKDLVVGSVIRGLAVLLNNGDGTFQDPVYYTTAMHTNPVSVTVGDFRGNGILDIVAVDNYNGVPSLSVLLGNGNGTFQPALTSRLDYTPYAVAAARFRPNGFLDLVIVNQQNNSVSVLLGNGNGTFTTEPPITVGNIPTSVAVGDFNGDGNLDIVTGNYFSVSVLLGDGHGNFTTGSPITGPLGLYNSMAVGDFRGNGMPHDNLRL